MHFLAVKFAQARDSRSECCGGMDSTTSTHNEPRLMITKIVCENFKSYAGSQELGPFHKVNSCCSRVLSAGITSSTQQCGCPSMFDLDSSGKDT